MITAAGKSRSVIIVVPTGLAAGKAPLVVALHGNGDTNSNFISGTTTLESLAQSNGFVLAAPQGISQNISIGGQMVNGVDWDPYRDVSAGNIDIPLIDAIFADLGASSSVDASKHVVFGYSQGGYMSFRYGMDKSAALACTGLIGAANPLGPQLISAAPRKIPVALQIGTNDGAIGQARNTKAALESAGFPLDYHEIQGAGHVPVAGGVTVPLTYCLGQTLP
jgi:poly(3-hydroxybutyrate) depolymerase